MSNVIILKSVYGKVNQIYYIQPCPDPKTGRLPSCVKPVNSNGDMILTEKEKDEISSGLKHYVAADHVFEIVDGTSYDLDDVIDLANWESIKYCNWIAKDRFERDSNGVLVVDGGARRYGVADLYIDRPGEVIKSKVSKKKLIHTASSYIYEDSTPNKIKKARVLGRDLRKANEADITDYLIEHAEKNPKKILDLYEGEDWKMHLFILDAVERGVIRKSDGLYKYDDKMLGGSIEATITFLRDIRFKKLLSSIKMETYPELMTSDEINEINSQVLDGTPHTPEKKTDVKKAGTTKK